MRYKETERERRRKEDLRKELPHLYDITGVPSVYLPIPYHSLRACHAPSLRSVRQLFRQCTDPHPDGKMAEEVVGDGQLLINCLNRNQNEERGDGWSCNRYRDASSNLPVFSISLSLSMHTPFSLSLSPRSFLYRCGIAFPERRLLLPVSLSLLPRDLFFSVCLFFRIIASLSIALSSALNQQKEREKVNGKRVDGR